MWWNYIAASFSPSALGGLKLWLDGADPSTITISSGTSISKWADKSGNGYDFTNSGAGQPDVHTGGIGGLNDVRFNAGQSLSNTSAPLVTGSQPFTIFCVFDRAATATYSYLAQFIGDGAGNSPGLFLTFTDPGSENINFGAKLTGTFGSARCATSFGSYNTPYALCITYNGSGATITDYAFYSSNSLQTTVVAQDLTVTSTVNVLGAFTNTGSDPLLGNIGEMIIYNRVLNSTEMAQMEAYFLAKWGV